MAREAMSTGIDGLSAQATEPTMKIAMPMSSTRLRPYTSESLP